MKQLTGWVTNLSRTLDKLAGLCMVAVMLLVVSNVLLRVLFKSPILGAYEYVGFLTALMISFALAFCAVQNAHIAVGFVVDRLPGKIQGAVDIIVHTLALGFWVPAAWHLMQYGHSLMSSGVVSATAQISFYPFVYLVAFSLLALSLVLLVRLVESVNRVMASKSVLNKAVPVSVAANKAMASKAVASK